MSPRASPPRRGDGKSGTYGGSDSPPGLNAGRRCRWVLHAHGLVRIAAAAACVTATACYHWAEVTTTWNGRGHRPISFEHVVAIFATDDASLRRALEDRLVDHFPNGEPSYRALAKIAPGNVAGVRGKLDDDRFDSAIIMTVVWADSLPPSFIAVLPRTRHPFPAAAFMDQWERVWNPSFDPAFVPAKRLIAIELQIYSLGDDQLVWAGRGDAGDAKALASLGEAAVRNLTRELAREGLIAMEPGVRDTRNAEWGSHAEQRRHWTRELAHDAPVVGVALIGMR
jgi:hypothetical protein